MQRYFIAAERFIEKTVTITGDDAHHLSSVMRARSGDQVIVCDGKGREALAVLVGVGKNEVTAKLVEIRETLSEPSVQVTIAQAMPKGDKMETVIQKGTEIGASRFIPFVSERTIVQYDNKKESKRLERWGKIAKEAAEQAHRGRIPDIDPVCSWQQLLKLAQQTDAAFLCYEKQSDMQLRSKLAALRAKRGNAAQLMLVIGPEGGFTEQEAREAEAVGLMPVSLGKRILRTETAAMVGLSCILYEYGEIGG